MTKYIDELIEILKEFPGIGQRGAERIVFQILKWPPEKVETLGQKIKQLPDQIRTCKICGNISESEICEICSSHERDKNIICVVEEFSHIIPINKSGYKGVFHVLGGKISPLNNIEAEQLNLASLIERIKSSDITEVVLALSQDVEGQATAVYISEVLKKEDVKITTLARGIPAGADISYANSATISVAMNGRTEMNK
ncbi:MAG: recombination mediator RecR [Victivallales bacterium]|nr:recombination mediator RecR [Victivallales bacterium]